MVIFVVLKRKFEQSRHHIGTFQSWLAHPSNEEYRQRPRVGKGVVSILLFDYTWETWWANWENIQRRIHPVLVNPSPLFGYQRQPASLRQLSHIWPIRCLWAWLRWRTWPTPWERGRRNNWTWTNQQNKPSNRISILLWKGTIQDVVFRNVCKGDP